MKTDLRISLVQMTSTMWHEGNALTVSEHAKLAAESECDLMALPEASGMINRFKEAAMKVTTPEGQDPFILACRELSARYSMWIHIGSTPIQENGKLLNHCVLIDDVGEIRARYDKIHLFDVFLQGRKASRESDRYTAGTEAVVVSTPWGPWGLSICYDLRFPNIYRDYAKEGATVIFAPSAFTVPTGQAHWELLVRARAVDSGCWIVAAAQVGQHEDGRKTYGHSLIVSPWGEVVTDLGGDCPGQTMVDLDLQLVEQARRQIPSLKNERNYRLISCV